jgi:uncharacterized membrane protein
VAWTIPTPTYNDAQTGWITIYPASGNAGTFTGRDVSITIPNNTLTASRSATISITGGGISKSILVAQTGFTSLTRLISLSGNLTYTNTQSGQTETKTLRITNTGTGTLTVSSISYPPSGVFSGSWSSGTINASSYKDVSIYFTPDAAGDYSGTLTVNSDGTGTNTIAIEANCVEPSREILLSAEPFPAVLVGEISISTLYITNEGTTTLTCYGVTHSKPTLFSGDYSGTVAPGATAQVDIYFTPINSGVTSETITVSSNKTSGINTVTVSGRGGLTPE